MRRILREILDPHVDLNPRTHAESFLPHVTLLRLPRHYRPSAPLDVTMDHRISVDAFHLFRYLLGLSVVFLCH